MALIPGSTGKSTKVVDGLEGPTAGSPAIFPSGFTGSLVPQSLADTNHTLTSSASAVIITPTNNRVITLPSSVPSANYSITVINRSPTFTVAINASAGGTVATLGLGQITIVSTQINPTTTAHWFISTNGAVLHNGNSLGGALVLGTNDNFDLSFKTNNATRMTLSTNGNLAISAITNQISLGVTNITTISAQAPSASRIYTIPDATTNANFIMSNGTNTIAGTLTLPATVNYTGAGSVIKSGAHALTLTTSNTTNATFPSGTITLADLGSAQIFTGDKTFSGVLTLPATVNYTGAGSIVKNGTHALTLTTSNTTNVTFPSGTITLVDLSTTQTITALKTFSSGVAITGGSANNNTLWTASGVLRLRGGGSGIAIDNSSGVEVFSASNSGAVSIGPLAGGVQNSIFGGLRYGSQTTTSGSPAGTINALDLNGFSVIRLNSNMTINGFNPGTNNQIVYCYMSNLSSTITINHDSTSATSVEGRIWTSTSGTVSGARRAVFIYCSTALRWIHLSA